MKKILRKLKNWIVISNPFRRLAIAYIGKLNREEYRRPPFSTPNERPAEYSFVFKHIAANYPKSVLDVGTGLTSLPHLIANCGIKVTAIDNIKDYWTNNIFNRHFYVMNENIAHPTLDTKFDMITCVSTLEHVRESEEAISSMFNLLKTGGHLILTFPYNEKKGVENVYALPESTLTRQPTYQSRAFCREDLERWQKKYGAIIADQEYWRFFTGDYWTTGTYLSIPQKVTVDAQHQISCIIFCKQ